MQPCRRTCACLEEQQSVWNGLLLAELRELPLQVQALSIGHQQAPKVANAQHLARSCSSSHAQQPYARQLQQSGPMATKFRQRPWAASEQLWAMSRDRTCIVTAAA